MGQMLANGVQYFPGYLKKEAQEALCDEIRKIVGKAPLFVPKMPRTGKPMSVRMTNCGSLGWVTDKESGYRYQPTHPVTQEPWPLLPKRLKAIWDDIADYAYPPEACLINFYGAEAKMGMHQDRDEKDFKAPVLSISLGETCLFRMGQKARGGPTTSLKLESGDIIILAGSARLIYHGVDRLYPGSSSLLKTGGRLNLTLRRVTEPDFDRD